MWKFSQKKNSRIFLKKLIMKTLLFLLIITISSSTNAQIASLETVRNFWDTNIMEIIRLDKEKIIEHTNYPVEGSWGYVLELEGEPDTWTTAEFNNGLPLIFNDQLRIALRSKTYNDLVHFENETGELEFIIQLTSITSTDDGDFESSTFLYFKKFEGVWKLFKMEYAG